MSEEIEVLKTVTGKLNDAGFPYMISGSIAGSYYAIPRMTRDIDIVIEMQVRDVGRFVSLFKKDFYIDDKMIKNEVARNGMFNLIHNEYVIKVDFIIRKDSEFQKIALSRRKKVLIKNSPMWFISPEDLIISKLQWARESGSKIQLQDVQNILRVTKGLDEAYIETWVPKLKLEVIYEQTKAGRS